MPAARQEPLFPRLVELVEAVTTPAPPRLVYSTRPLTGMCSDGKTYIVKGVTDQAIVQAEAAAYVLAHFAGVTVPEWSFVSAPSHADYPLFGSRIVPGYRDILPWLGDLAHYGEPLAQIVAFDIWIANIDRNLGNLIARDRASNAPGRVEIVAIDFEKAVAVRSATPRIDLGSTAPQALWPREQLGQVLRGLPRPSNGWLVDLAENSVAVLASALQEVQIALSLNIDWHTNVAEILAHRSAQLPQLVEEVWH